LVFADPETGKPYWQAEFRRTGLFPQRKKIGIGRIGWDTFRHSHCSLLHALGVDLKVQQELLRHADIRDDEYLHARGSRGSEKSKQQSCAFGAASASSVSLMLP
jgi:integrase